MGNFQRAGFKCAVAGVILSCGITVFGATEERDGASTGQNMVPAGIYSPSAAANQAAELRDLSVKPRTALGKSAASASSGFGKWELLGPTGWGRIWDIEVDPTTDQIVYMAGSSGGGVWKSIDQGTSWRNIFNNAKFQSIGDIAIDPSNHNTIWVGGGECLAGGGSIPYPGTGIYKSTDAGATWEFKGLDSSFYISRISIHPTNPNIVFVGVMGSLFSNNPDRGVYRTTDGGTTWEKVKYADDSTGCTDIIVHPTNPNRIIACFWTAMRYPFNRLWASAACRVWHSEDGGTTWAVYGTAEGLPASDVGRNTMCISNSNPNFIYLIYFNASNLIKGIWKTTNAGVSWTQCSGTPATSIYSYYGHTFCQIRCNPTNENDVIAMGMTCKRTTNGGTSWADCFPSSLHLDFHAIAWSRQNSSIMFLGDDGGLTKGTGGPTGTFTYMGRGALVNNGFSPGGFQIGQCYGIDVARDNDNYRYTGQQDAGTNMTTSGGQTYGTWQNIWAGDGFHVRVDPSNTNYVLGSLQYGGYFLITNKTIGTGFTLTGRMQWNSPVAFDSTSGRAYCGSQYVWSAPRGSTVFTQKSGDLTNGDHSVPNYPYGTVSAIAVYNGKCYAGTDDGNVWVSQNITVATPTWTKIRNGKLGTQVAPWTGPQERTSFDGWISDIFIDQSVTTGSTAYVTVWYFRWGRSYYKPRIYKLTNFGLGGVGSVDWQDISGDLPKQVTTTTLRKDSNPARAGWLYCSTDWGVYFSNNNGTNWRWLGDTAMPLVVCNDLCLHNSTNMLYVCTYGRGILRCDLTSVVGVQPNPAMVSKGTQTLGNYPNPVVNKTNIQFKVKERQKINLAIYDLTGKVVFQLLDKEVRANTLTTVYWNRTSQSGARVGAGTYICRVIGDKVTLAKEIVVK